MWLSRYPRGASGHFQKNETDVSCQLSENGRRLHDNRQRRSYCPCLNRTLLLLFAAVPIVSQFAE